MIAYLLRPEIFSGRRCNVRIETSSELTMGMTVVDWWGVTGLEPNCTVIRRLDAEAFFDLLIERIGRVPAPPLRHRRRFQDGEVGAVGAAQHGEAPHAARSPVTGTTTAPPAAAAAATAASASSTWK